MLANEELSTGVETEDLVIKLLGDIFGLGERLHSSIVDDNVDFSQGSARDQPI
jgi:hypothetical protein